MLGIVAATPPTVPAGTTDYGSLTTGGALRTAAQDGAGNDVSASHPLPVGIAAGSKNIGSVSPPPNSPGAGSASAIVTGGVAVTLITAPVNGGYIVNPLVALDQNIATAEVAYINPVTTATAVGNGTNVALQPGQIWYCPPGLAGSNVSAIAATAGHAFTVVVW